MVFFQPYTERIIPYLPGTVLTILSTDRKIWLHQISNYEEGIKMAVEEVGEKYRCNVCGNEVTVTEVGGGTLVCCGEDMEKIE